MTFFKNVSLFTVSALSIFCMINSANATTSGKIIFTGKIVRDVCALSDLNFNPVSLESGKLSFNMMFSECDMSPEDIRVNFYDLTQGQQSQISNEITFNLSENKEKIIEVNGKRYYQPVRLNGYYTQSDRDFSIAKLVAVEYH